MSGKVRTPGPHDEVQEKILQMLLEQFKRSGITYVEWAARAGIEVQSLQRLRSGKIKLSVYTLTKLAAGLGLSPVFTLSPREHGAPEYERKEIVKRPRAKKASEGVKAKAGEGSGARGAGSKPRTNKGASGRVLTPGVYAPSLPKSQGKAVVANFSDADLQSSLQQYVEDKGLGQGTVHRVDSAESLSGTSS